MKVFHVSFLLLFVLGAHLLHLLFDLFLRGGLGLFLEILGICSNQVLTIVLSR